MRQPTGRHARLWAMDSDFLLFEQNVRTRPYLVCDIKGYQFIFIPLDLRSPLASAISYRTSNSIRNL